LNRAILAGSVIVGIAVMLSMSMMPANADSVDNVCIRTVNTSPFFICQFEVEAGQHAILIFQGNPTSGCHYTVSDENPFWKFTRDHGRQNCVDVRIGFDLIVVRGS